MDMVCLGFEHNSFDAFYALNSFSNLSKDKFLEVLKNVCRLNVPKRSFLFRH